MGAPWRKDYYFNPRSPWGGRQRQVGLIVSQGGISIHAPRGGSDSPEQCFRCAFCISIHAPRGGSDFAEFDPRQADQQFQSTLPVGGATRQVRPRSQRNTNFNPRSPWGERQMLVAAVAGTAAFQSTLPVGGATRQPPLQLRHRLYFNPRSPWGERPPAMQPHNDMYTFQSTLPVGGATNLAAGFRRIGEISIHAPRGGSDRQGAVPLERGGVISIHAPRGGSDNHDPDAILLHKTFQSTLPVGGATGLAQPDNPLYGFQSTLPVGGATATGADARFCKSPDFNPRSPWGERPQASICVSQSSRFQSTLPVGGATSNCSR